MIKKYVIACVSAAMLVLILSSCDRRDTLRYLSNSSGSAYLEDILIGHDTRVMCVRKAREGYCRRKNADVYVTGVPQLTDVSAEWRGENVVVVRISSGHVRRFNRSVTIDSDVIVIKRSS